MNSKPYSDKSTFIPDNRQGRRALASINRRAAAKKARGASLLVATRAGRGAGPVASAA